jgi:hypothetical protein
VLAAAAVEAADMAREAELQRPLEITDGLDDDTRAWLAWREAQLEAGV